MVMRGHKRYRSGAWRLVVFAGFDEETGRRVDVHETVPGLDNRAGAKAADARLAEIIAAVESGKDIPGRSRRSSDAIAMTELAEQWQAAHRPRRNERRRCSCAARRGRTSAAPAFRKGPAHTPSWDSR